MGPTVDARWQPTAADLARDYERVPGALAKWYRADGATIARDTYGPTYTARKADGSSRCTYTAADALLWIGCSRGDDPAEHDRPVSAWVRRAQAGTLRAKVLA